MPTNPPHYMNKYYKKHKKKWNNPTEIHKRVERNKARRMMKKKLGRNPKGDVDHIKSLKSGGSTTMSNLRVLSKKKNRGRN